MTACTDVMHIHSLLKQDDGSESLNCLLASFSNVWTILRSVKCKDQLFSVNHSRQYFDAIGHKVCHESLEQTAIIVSGRTSMCSEKALLCHTFRIPMSTVGNLPNIYKSKEYHDA
jgi:hypothetical protein